jgi:hypothetical protein
VATEQFDERLDQVERALKIIEGIDNNPDLQNRTFDLLFGSTAPFARATRQAQAANDPESSQTGAGSGSSNGSVKARTATKRVSKPSTVSMDKNLDTAPNGIKSWKEFAAEKKPTNQNDKNTTAVYWLKELAKQAKVNTSQVVTLYDDADWKPAPNPKNSLQVAASSTGYIDTADMEDIQIGPRGIFRVKSELPIAPKK